MAWEDTRGGALRSERRTAHSDDAKDRVHEATRAARPGRRVPRLVVLAAGLLLLVGGGAAAALVATGSQEGPLRPDAASPQRDGGTQGGSGATGADPAGPSLDSGISFTGRTRFDMRVNNLGTTRVRVVCSPDCRADVESTRGHDEAGSWVPAAIQHDYTGSGSTWRSSAARPITGCAEIEADFWSDPDRWEATMRVTAEGVSIRAVLPAYDGGSCFVTRTVMSYTGIPVE